MREDQSITVAQPLAEVSQQETEDKVTPEILKAVLSHVHGRVAHIPDLCQVVVHLQLGDPGRAVACFKSTHRGSASQHEDFGLIGQLVRGAMCQHHADIFLTVYAALKAVNVEGEPNRG